MAGVVGLALLATSAPALGQCEEVQKLLADDGAAEDYSGWSVSVSGDVAVIGAFFDDDNGEDSGSVYVYRFSGAEWHQEQKLLPDDGEPGNRFGTSVSVAGDVAVIGASEDNDNGAHSGSAYVFQFNGTEWVQTQKLLADDGERGDGFGIAVHVANDVAVIGAAGDAGMSGSAYVFRFTEGEWRQEQKVWGDGGRPWEFFGFSVSVSGDTLVIGATDAQNGGTRSGAAYVFRRLGAEWIREQKLLADDGAHDDMFGRSVSLSGDVAVIGAYRDDDNGSDSGSAYVFRFNGTTWFQEQKLVADDGTASDGFGHSASVTIDMAVIGAPSGGDDNGNRAGSAYVFRWTGVDWRQDQELLAADGVAADTFGVSVSVGGDVAVIGAFLDDDNGSDSGSAYVFDLANCAPCIRDPEWLCDGDVDGDGQVNPVDAGLVQAAFGSDDAQDLCSYDHDCDGQINPVDSGIVQSLFGTCDVPRKTCP